MSRSLRERVPFNARTAKSNFAVVCSLKAGTTGEEILAELKTGTLGVCAFGKGGDTLGDVLLAGLFALAMTRCLAKARVSSDVRCRGGLTSVAVEFIW